MNEQWTALLKNPGLLEPGDIIHVQSQGWLSIAIRFITTTGNESQSWASHTAMVYKVAGSEILIVEALSKVEIHPITYYLKQKSKLKIMRKPGGLTIHRQRIIQHMAMIQFGENYGWITMAAHLLDRFLGNRFIIRRLVNMEDYPICSWLVSWCYQKGTGISFTVPPEAAQPDDIMDYCESNLWPLIWQSEHSVITGQSSSVVIFRHSVKDCFVDDASQ